MAEKEKEITSTTAAEQDGSLYLLSAVAQKEEALKVLEGHVKEKGKIIKAESLGKKTLAYPINKHNELFLLSVFFTAEPATIPALEKELKIEDAVERFLLTDWNGDVSKEPSEFKSHLRKSAERGRSKERVSA